MDYQTVIFSRQDKVATLKLNRPDAYNAFNTTMMDELSHALLACEKDADIAVIIITGSEKCFAAGADIKEIADKTFSQVYHEQFISKNWETITQIRKPVIAAVSGLALGGGFELALMCDLIIADETARFQLPETTIGIIPGAGGTQRLTRIAGKALAMDIILTGRSLSAQEALAHGLISRLVPAGQCLDETQQIAKKIAKNSSLITIIAKEAVNQAYQTHLDAGLYIERRLLYSTFATHDRKEGLAAFREKRQANFINE